MCPIVRYPHSSSQDRAESATVTELLFHALVSDSAWEAIPERPVRETMGAKRAGRAKRRECPTRFPDSRTRYGMAGDPGGGFG